MDREPSIYFGKVLILTMFKKFFISYHLVSFHLVFPYFQQDRDREGQSQSQRRGPGRPGGTEGTGDDDDDDDRPGIARPGPGMMMMMMMVSVIPAGIHTPPFSTGFLG